MGRNGRPGSNLVMIGKMDMAKGVDALSISHRRTMIKDAKSLLETIMEGDSFTGQRRVPCDTGHTRTNPSHLAFAPTRGSCGSQTPRAPAERSPRTTQSSWRSQASVSLCIHPSVRGFGSRIRV
jgi:hypothetical protein